MKSIIIVGVLALSLVACSNDDFKKSEQLVEYTNPYDFVGKLHNEGLNYIANRRTGLTRENGTDVYEPADISHFSIEYLSEILENDPRFDISSYCQVDARSEIEDGLRDVYSRIGNDDEIPFYEDISNVYSMTNDLNVSSKVQNELIDIYQSFSTYTGVALSSYLNNKVQTIILGNFDEEERRLLLTFLSIGQNSLDYWEEHPNDNALSYKNIAKADLVGAARGIYRNIKVIAVCSIAGGFVGGGQALLRYALIQSVIDSSIYAFIEYKEESGEAVSENDNVHPDLENPIIIHP